MSRGILATVGVALLLLTAGCAGSLAPDGTSAAAQQSERSDVAQQFDRGDRTIQVAASGEAETTPNQAVVRVAAVARADDANVVRQRLAENASGVREALRNLGLADDQIRTVAYNIDQQYRERGGDRVPDGFEGIHAFEITLSNVSQAGMVVDTAVENGADRVDNVELTLSEERRQEVRAEALRDAMSNARADADVIAESANLTVTGVHSAATGDLSYTPVRAQALEAEDAAGQTRTEIESGPVTVTAQVQVTYNATDAGDGATEGGSATTDDGSETTEA
ncbi:SIMPL domain-containing protein [Halobacteriales archaeon SW_6_65_15]|nr:MAG: SIMPL domain-containing protein [Halobacteriales archaeon SW_6_65_15]